MLYSGMAQAMARARYVLNLGLLQAPDDQKIVVLLLHNQPVDSILPARRQVATTASVGWDRPSLTSRTALRGWATFGYNRAYPWMILGLPAGTYPSAASDPSDFFLETNGQQLRRSSPIRPAHLVGNRPRTFMRR